MNTVFYGGPLASLGLSGGESTCNAGGTGATGSVPGPGRSPGGGHGNPLQYSCLENPTDRGAWRATDQGVTKSQTQVKQLSTHACRRKDSLNSLLDNFMPHRIPRTEHCASEEMAVFQGSTELGRNAFCTQDGQPTTEF